MLDPSRVLPPESEIKLGELGEVDLLWKIREAPLKRLASHDHGGLRQWGHASATHHVMRRPSGRLLHWARLIALLNGVCQFVREEGPACGRVGLIPTSCKDNMR